MATDKEIIQKLFKIAQNQQKAINKLAQEAGLVPQTQHGASDSWADITPQIDALLAQTPGAAQIGAPHNVLLSPASGVVDGRIKTTLDSLGTPKLEAFKQGLVQSLLGKTFDVGGQQLTVSSNPQDIKLIYTT